MFKYHVSLSNGRTVKISQVSLEAAEKNAQDMVEAMNRLSGRSNPNYDLLDTRISVRSVTAY